jgi:hypothetical protein
MITTHVSTGNANRQTHYVTVGNSNYFDMTRTTHDAARSLAAPQRFLSVWFLAARLQRLRAECMRQQQQQHAWPNLSAFIETPHQFSTLIDAVKTAAERRSIQ